MNKVHNVVAALIAALAIAPFSTGAEARSPSKAQLAQAQMAKAQAGKIRMMKMKQAQAGQAGMATALVTAATLQATDAGECSPYLAKWMMTRNPAMKAQYEACMAD